MTDARAGLWVCPNGCRRERITEPTTAYKCADCNATMEHDTKIQTPEEARLRKLEDRQKDMVHKADLRELVETFREWADQYDRDVGDLSAIEKTTVADYHRCADELEELIEDE